MSDTQDERRTVIFTGRVQGVGFRWTTRRTAAKFDVQGYVRNMPNGSVELVAEGTPSELDRFIAAVEEAMSGYIDDRRQSHESTTGEFDSFGIRR